MSERGNNERRTSTYIAYFRHALVNDLNNSLKLRTVELADSVAEILLLLKGEDIIIRDRFLRLLALGSWGTFHLLRRGFRC